MTELARQIPHYEYSFNDGPLTLPELHQKIDTGNCRLLAQLFFERGNGHFFPLGQLLNPQAYQSLGTFVRTPEDDPATFFDGPETGHVIYAERVRDKQDRPINTFSAEALGSEEAYLKRLHSAIFLKDSEDCDRLLSPEIPRIGTRIGRRAVLHATSIQGSTVVWPLPLFLKFYRPVAIKKFI